MRHKTNDMKSDKFLHIKKNVINSLFALRKDATPRGRTANKLNNNLHIDNNEYVLVMDI